MCGKFNYKSQSMAVFSSFFKINGISSVSESVERDQNRKNFVISKSHFVISQPNQWSLIFVESFIQHTCESFMNCISRKIPVICDLLE